MTLRYVSGALTAIALICGLPTVAPVYAQTRDATLLPPEQSGTLTVAGCLQVHDDEYVLASPRVGPIANVPVERCNAAVDERALDLKDTEDFGINQSMIGHWIEVSGKLEKETDADLNNLREIEIRSFRLLPVVPPPPPPAPRVSEQQPYTPPAEPIAPPEEQPVATTGVSEPALPKTASPLPTFGFLGLLSLAGAVALRFNRPHQHG